MRALRARKEIPLASTRAAIFGLRGTPGDRLQSEPFQLVFASSRGIGSIFPQDPLLTYYNYYITYTAIFSLSVFRIPANEAEITRLALLGTLADGSLLFSLEPWATSSAAPPRHP